MATPPTPPPTPAAIGTILDCVDCAGGADGDSVAGGRSLIIVGTPETTAVEPAADVVSKLELSLLVEDDLLVVELLSGTEVVGTTPMVVNTVGASRRHCQQQGSKTVTVATYH